MNQIDLPDEILELMREESRLVRLFWKSDNEFYKWRARQVRADIDSRYWATFELTRVV